MKITSNIFSDDEILEQLKELGKRISRIEKQLDLPPLTGETTAAVKSDDKNAVNQSSESLEFHIGQFWFAKTGIVVLAIGIAFLLTFPYKDLPAFMPVLFGYLLVAGIFLLSHYWRKTFTFIAGYLLGGGLLLFYFTTLRLYFFANQPIVSNLPLAMLFMLTVVAINLVISVRKKSIYLASVSMTLFYITAILGEGPIFIFTLLSFCALLLVYFKIKLSWNNLYIYGIVLTYLTHFIWFINNPFMGNKIEFVSGPAYNIVFILLYSLIFSSANLIRSGTDTEPNINIINSFLNSFGCYGLFLLITLAKFNTYISSMHFVASVFFLALSIIFWVRDKSKYSTFFYAIAGYTAMSVSIIAGFDNPDFFILLSWQSLVVISTAIWFRSKFIIVANFIIYLVIFIAYLVMAGKVDAISVSFGIIALISARVLNWQKSRLELKTELMRNAYLTVAFFIFPYALYHLVPGAYVSLAWIGITILYYGLSVTLNNKKYRWMALLTLMLTVIYLFIIGITKLDPVYRIVSFIALGLVLIVISLVYTRFRTKSGMNE